MTTSTLPRLQVRDVVPLAEAEASVAQLHDRLVALQRDLLIAEREAEEAEAASASVAAASPFASRVATLSDRLLRDLQAAHLAELQARIQDAELQATSRVEAARAEAQAIVAEAQAEIASALLARSPGSAVIDLTAFRRRGPSSAAPSAASSSDGEEVTHTVADAALHQEVSRPDVPAERPSALSTPPPDRDVADAVGAEDLPPWVDELPFGPELDLGLPIDQERAHAVFWEEQEEAVAARRRSFAPVEALLPTLALLVVLAVLLVLFG